MPKSKMDGACDHTLVQTKLRWGRFISQCRCGLVVSTDFTVPPQPLDFSLEDLNNARPK